MKARELIALLAQHADQDAEVMIEARDVRIATIGVRVGEFPDQPGPMSGRPWVMVVGSECWEQPGRLVKPYV